MGLLLKAIIRKTGKHIGSITNAIKNLHFHRSQITLNNSLRYWVEKEMSPPITSDESSFFNTSFRGEIESSSDTKNTDSSILGKRGITDYILKHVFMGIVD